MPESYFNLSNTEKKQILQTASNQLKKSEAILEKDIWLCWVLKILFSMPEHNMAFKGGTSLSKIYKFIDRFSEDIDITIDYTKFSNPKNVDINTANKTQIKKFSDHLKMEVSAHIQNKIIPHMKNAGMLNSDAPEFDSIIDTITSLQNGLNRILSN